MITHVLYIISFSILWQIVCIYIQRGLQAYDLDAERPHSMQTGKLSAKGDSQPEPDTDPHDENSRTQVREI